MQSRDRAVSMEEAYRFSILYPSSHRGQSHCHLITSLPCSLLLGCPSTTPVFYPWSYLKVSPMLGAQLGEELRWIWDVALENCLQPGQGRGGEAKSETR